MDITRNKCIQMQIRRRKKKKLQLVKFMAYTVFSIFPVKRQESESCNCLFSYNKIFINSIGIRNYSRKCYIMILTCYFGFEVALSLRIAAYGRPFMLITWCELAIIGK
jgi:hypothetical protein